MTNDTAGRVNLQGSLRVWRLSSRTKPFRQQFGVVDLKRASGKRRPVLRSNGRPLGDGSFCETWIRQETPPPTWGQTPESAIRGPGLR